MRRTQVTYGPRAIRSSGWIGEKWSGTPATFAPERDMCRPKILKILLAAAGRDALLAIPHPESLFMAWKYKLQFHYGALWVRLRVGLRIWNGGAGGMASRDNPLTRQRLPGVATTDLSSPLAA